MGRFQVGVRSDARALRSYIKRLRTAQSLTTCLTEQKIVQINRSQQPSTMDSIFRTLFLLSPVFLSGCAQEFGGGTQFVCTSVPKDADLCAASMQNSAPAEDLKSTVLQLRETVLQQKETIISQKETIRELTGKLTRCEGLPGQDEGPGGPGGPGGSGGPGQSQRTGGRKKEQGKNTMGDVSRAPGETLAQLGLTLATLKQRLENLEVSQYLI